MRIILGAVLIFGAAWLMVRLQAGSGSCCGGGHAGENPGPGHSHNCCEDTNMTPAVDKENKIEN
ncbi:hypothetical protein KAJ77_10615 [bacterium]|nr:hypothetical protein [bacterium]